ncbi:type I restriction enzyme endonuclease domain-containing protein [Micromonospora sp. NPDC005707]|uniref:type I restriction enzyme endonuclease domain-containing protein n=1 Tax=Micromonospora sp. NPDC005707 TaxID=3157050 RepID=UPI0033CD87EE
MANIACNLAKSLRRFITVDWTSCDDVGAKLRSTIKRSLAAHRCPPYAVTDASQRVAVRTETFAEDWSAGQTVDISQEDQGWTMTSRKPGTGGSARLCCGGTGRRRTRAG